MRDSRPSKIIFFNNSINQLGLHVSVPEDTTFEKIYSKQYSDSKDSNNSEEKTLSITDVPDLIIKDEGDETDLREKQAEFSRQEEQIRHKLLLLVLPLIFSASIAFSFREMVEFSYTNKSMPFNNNISKSNGNVEHTKSNVYFLFFVILYTGGAASSIFIIYELYSGRTNTDDKYLTFNDNFRYTRLSYSIYGDKTNLFLRIAVIFCGLQTLACTIMSLISEMLTTCYHTIEIITIVTKLVFVTAECLVLFFSNKIVFIQKAIIIKSLLYFLLTINLSEFVHSLIKDFKPIIYIALDKKSTDKGIECFVESHFLYYYLQPGKLQYLITSVFIIRELSTRCGKLEFIQLILDPIRPLKDRFNNSLIGMSISCVLVIFTGTLMGLIFHLLDPITQKFDEQIKLKVTYLLFTSEMCINILGMISNGLLLWQTKDLKPSIPFLTSKSIISFLNICIFCVACYITTEYFLNVPNFYQFIGTEIYFRIILSVVQILQVSLQMYTVRICIFKCNCDFKAMFDEKPGRQAICVLIGVNFSCCILKDFLRSLFNHHTYTSPKNQVNQGNLLLHALATILSPFYSMFHFTSLVLYCDLFVKMYHKESYRVANLWQRLSEKSRRQSIGIFASETENSRSHLRHSFIKSYSRDSSVYK